MENPSFEAYRWQSGKVGQGKLIAYENQYYVCLKLNNDRAQTPVLIFCRSANLNWHDDDIGYVVSFERFFFGKAIWCNLENLGLYEKNRPVSYVLDNKALDTFAPVFEKMCDNLASNYFYKYDLMRTYLLQVIHLTIKLHIQTVDILKSPLAYLKLTTSSIDVLLRLTLSHNPDNEPST
jgi:hypothetical protein